MSTDETREAEARAREKRLRELAAAATPGPWQSMRDGNQYVGTRYMPTAKCVGASRVDGLPRPWNPHAMLAHGLKAEGHEVSRFLDADADYIEAVQPSNIVALLEEADRLRTEVADLRKRLLDTTPTASQETWRAHANEMERQRDEERARADKAEAGWEAALNARKDEAIRGDVARTEVAALTAERDEALRRFAEEARRVHSMQCQGAFSLGRDPFNLMPAVDAYAEEVISGGKMRECIRRWLAGEDFREPATREWER